MRPRAVVLGAAGALGAAALGVAAYHSARVELPRAVRAAIARTLGVAPAAVSFRAARLDAFGVVVDDLAAGQLTARRARFSPSPGALVHGRLEGRLHLEQLLVEDPPLPAPADELANEIDRIEAADVDVELRGGAVRARIRGVGIALDAGPPQVTIAELGVEAERDRTLHVRRLAFTGLTAGPLAHLAGRARLEDGELTARAAGPGVTLAARAAAEGASATLAFERFPLTWRAADAPWLVRLGLPTGHVAASGTVRARAPRGQDAAADLTLRLDGGELDAPRLSPEPIAADGIAITAHGAFRRDPTGPSAKTAELDVRLQREAATIELHAALVSGPEAAVTARLTLPRTDCAALLASTPPALRRALDGMALSGEVGARFDLRVPLADPGRLELDGGVDLRCTVVSEPPLADVARLADEAPLLPGARDALGAPRRIELGPASASYRRLDRIPAPVVATLVAAEDGAFYRHRGLDLSTLRRALAHDLERGAPEQGGSTITQQVAKNLFLSGERTFGRKLEESVLAWRLEARLGKRRILELYLNLIELGPGIYGISEGARHWFHKDVAQLTTGDAAQLAALLPAPRRGMDEAFATRLRKLRARLPGPWRAQAPSAAARAVLAAAPAAVTEDDGEAQP